MDNYLVTLCVKDQDSLRYAILEKYTYDDFISAFHHFVDALINVASRYPIIRLQKSRVSWVYEYLSFTGQSFVVQLSHYCNGNVFPIPTYDRSQLF